MFLFASDSKKGRVMTPSLPDARKRFVKQEAGTIQQSEVHLRLRLGELTVQHPEFRLSRADATISS